MEKSNVTSFPKEKAKKEEKNILKSLSPREIVSELDRFVVGQNNAKRAVAIALRNRWRRQALDDDMKDEVLPKNILMMGPTGVGKTSSFISSFKACLLHLFLKAIATALFALFCPTTNLSSSDTISLGEREFWTLLFSFGTFSFGKDVTFDFFII